MAKDGERGEVKREKNALGTPAHTVKKDVSVPKLSAPITPAFPAKKPKLSAADRVALKEKAASMLPPVAASVPGMKPTPAEKKRADGKQRMLVALMTPGVFTVRKAALVAGVDFSSHYEWAREDERYAAAAKDAIELQTQYLEEAAHQRAIGEHGKQPSDLLAIFLLKGRRPEVYRDNAKIEHGGNAGGPLSVQIVSFADPKAAPPQKKEDA